MKPDQLPVQANLHDISITGMFLATASTFPAGTQFTFVIESEDGLLGAVEGTAMVSWRRQLSAGPARPAGIGCSFEHIAPEDAERLRSWLESNSSRRIDRAVPDRSSLSIELSRYAVEASTDRLAEVDEPPPQEPTEAPVRQFGGAAAAHAGFPTWVWPALLLILILCAAVVGSVWWSGRKQAQRSQTAIGVETGRASEVTPESGSDADRSATDAEELPAPQQEEPDRNVTPPEEAENAPANAEVAAEAAVEEARQAPRPSPRFGEEQAREIRLLVRQWAAAWSDQDPDRYMGFYSGGYTPPGTSRQQWIADRRIKLTRPASIDVKITELTVQPIAGQESGGLVPRAEASFTQRYEAPNYRDVVRKWLTLEPDADGGWLIIDERSAPAS